MFTCYTTYAIDVNIQLFFTFNVTFLFTKFMLNSLHTLAKWPISAGAYPSFCSIKQLGVFLLPPE